MQMPDCGLKESLNRRRVDLTLPVGGLIAEDSGFGIFINMKFFEQQGFEVHARNGCVSVSACKEAKIELKTLGRSWPSRLLDEQGRVIEIHDFKEEHCQNPVGEEDDEEAGYQEDGDDDDG